MSRVKAVFSSSVLEPRKFLLVAGLLTAMGLVTGYVDVQSRADRALALRQGAPAAVALQDFAPLLHIGPAKEVTVLAEADLADPIILTLRGSNPMKTAVVFPLFPISDTGASVIRARLDDPAQIVTDGIETGPSFDDPNALGLLFHILPQGDRDLSGLDSYLSQEIGQGAFGEIIELNGEAVEPGSFTLMADGALSAKEQRLANTFLAVAPYVDGREAALALPPPMREHFKLYWAALVLVLIALLVSVRADRDGAYSGERGAHEVDEDFGGGMGSHPFFAPIPSQSELQQAERSSGQVAATSSLAGIALRKLWQRATLSVKNRQPRREDEAL